MHDLIMHHTMVLKYFLQINNRRPLVLNTAVFSVCIRTDRLGQTV